MDGYKYLFLFTSLHRGSGERTGNRRKINKRPANTHNERAKKRRENWREKRKEGKKDKKAKKINFPFFPPFSPRQKSH